jgi:hypothetical protein
VLVDVAKVKANVAVSVATLPTSTYTETRVGDCSGVERSLEIRKLQLLEKHCIKCVKKRAYIGRCVKNGPACLIRTYVCICQCTFLNSFLLAGRGDS